MSDQPASEPTAPAKPAASEQPAGSEQSAGPSQTRLVEILPPQYWAETALPESDDEDNDSSLGDDSASSTASITSSVLAYRTIHGRTYHSERGNASYWHHLHTVLLDDKLYIAPLERDRLKRALDIGTGTGLWVIDFADEFPECDVTGTDLSPIQPCFIPPNANFVIEDCTQPWTFRRDHFDYIHMRLLFGSIPDWDALFAEAYDVCAPGGWIESLETTGVLECDDGTMPPRSAMEEWGKFFVNGGRLLGRTFEVLDLHLQRKGMEKAGFQDIVVRDIKVPFGKWPKDPREREIGVLAQATVEEDYEGYLLLMASLVGWSKEEVIVFCAQLRKQVNAGKAHAYWRERIVYGRKPQA